MTSDDPQHADGAAAFDYLIGSWWVRHRFWSERTGRWLRLQGPYRLEPLLDGSANLDRAEIADMPPYPFIGSSIRVYDPGEERWSIGWIDNLSHAFGVIVSGAMRGGRGEFHGTRPGRAGTQLVRFRWRFLAPDRARWIQGVSDDDGATWRATWAMSFRREPDVAQGRTRSS